MFLGLKKLVYLIALFFLLLIIEGAQAAESDAIGIRIIPNPDNYSVNHWYAAQGYVGSPQSLIVDSYPAIRDGRTVYVNMANIKDDNLYTNILIISYNQDPSFLTVDIFGQIVKNLKFNSNVSGAGFCSVTKEKACVNDSDCASGEYCDSQKSKIIRDVRRLEDLAKIKYYLDNYRAQFGFYPRLLSGTYFPGVSLSVWPSWQGTLAKELGGALPVDPINKLGDCPGFDKVTCWDEKTKKFAFDLDKKLLPPGAHAYLYYGRPNGDGMSYCTQMESGYKNLNKLNCFADGATNSAPVIKEVNLSGVPGKSFLGYVWLTDADNDKVQLKVDLINPLKNDWLSKGWGWDSGLDNFNILSSTNGEHFKLYAPVTGNYVAAANNYQVRLTADDGRGLPNSISSNIYPLNIGFGEASLVSVGKTMPIGENASLLMPGQDIDGTPISTIFFKKAIFNSQEISRAELEKRGFRFDGMKLLNNYTSFQKTGAYAVNVYALSGGTGKEISAVFSYNIINNPPAFQKLIAYFPDETSSVCEKNNCSFNIYNGEKTTIKVFGVDNENHKINYELVDNLGGKISINKDSGVISGLEKLNSGDEKFKTFTIKLKMFDNYCANSSENDCSIFYSFDVVVHPICSSDNPKSFLQVSANGPFQVTQSGQRLETGLAITDCGEVLGNNAMVAFEGVTETIDRNQAIVVVSDVSASMKNNVVINGEAAPAIERLRSALIGSGGLLDGIYNFASTPERINQKLFIKIAMFSYSNMIWRSTQKSMGNITLPGFLNDLKDYVRNYGAYGGTNTLEALNESERILDGVGDANTDKIAILISDGLPTIDRYVYYRYNYCRDDRPKCACYLDGLVQGDGSNCREPKELEEGNCQEKRMTTTRYEYWSNNCAKYEVTYCPNGVLSAGKDVNGCEDLYCYWPNNGGGGASFNPYQKLKLFFASLFKIFETKAITEHDVCANITNDENNVITCGEGFTYMENQYKSVTQEVCNSAQDVSKQAELMKAKGITLYTIYYNTQGDQGERLGLKENMCSWSSNNGKGCDNNLYAFSGQNIDEMVNKLSSNLKMNKPSDVKVNDTLIYDPDPSSINSTGLISLDGLNCSNLNPQVTYKNKGSLRFSDIKIDYCPIKKRLN